MNFNWHILSGVSVGIKFVTFCQEGQWKEIMEFDKNIFRLNATQSQLHNQFSRLLR